MALKQARVAVNGYGVVDPAALIERRVPLMVFARSRQMLASSLEVLSWLRGQGANCLVVSENECNAIGNGADLLRPEYCAGRERDARICGAAGAYRARPADRPVLALQKRLDTDHPRGLSKVTRTHSRRSDNY
jgi:hypothetical protein